MNYVITDTLTKDIYTAKSLGESQDAIMYILGGQELTEYEDLALDELFEFLLDENDAPFESTVLGIRVVVSE